ncbi:Deformed epidermal autoregulatory factor 1-like protein [Madurella fahalii]|uniref:Deformed epidermal autoregulatory factor 1-like protein n=1 Tax=Madurella fahalii TaxID=1157608 RepID=A0ABQ0GJB1_9PEZI
MHMPTPIALLAPFSPGSGIPAVSLTQDLPQGVDADILLLGCADLRHILYTLYAERGFPQRKIDFTACDVNENVIARNILLLTLILDGNESASLAQLWNVYYHFYLDETDIQLVGVQARKLLGLSRTLQDWHASSYGASLRFGDESTLSMVHQAWAKYADAVRSKDTDDYQNNFEARLKESRSREAVARRAKGVTARSCSPLSEALAKDLFEGTNQHWETGFSRPPPPSCRAPVAQMDPMFPNPVFAVPLNGPSMLKYPTDPLLSFHLAAAAAKLTELSPLRLDEQKAGDADVKIKLFEMAQLQFKEWINAFRDAVPRTTVRFIAADCFTLCYTLRHCLRTGEKCAHRYRRETGFDVLSLADCEYGVGAKAPKQFDVIDTSTLSDRTGVLNLLVSARPLMKDVPFAALYTHTLRRTTVEGKPLAFEDLLHGYTATVSTLLGLIPAEYWTNAKTQSPTRGIVVVDDTPHDDLNPASPGFQPRVAWKHSRHMSGRQPQMTKLLVKAPDLALLAYKMYGNMFEDEASTFMTVRSGMLVVEQTQDLRYHCGSFAAFLKALCEPLEVDPRLVCSDLLTMAVKTNNRSSQLHLPSLAFELTHRLTPQDPSNWAKNLLSKNPNRQPVGFRKWADIPSVVAVTLVVPADRWKTVMKRVTEQSLSTCIPMEARVGIASSMEAADLDIQISFGTVTTRGSHDEDGYTLIVEDDKEGWNGSSPMIVSFNVLSALIDNLYWDTDVGLYLVRTPLILFDSELGEKRVIFQAPFRDQHHVFITKQQPGQSGLYIDLDKFRDPRPAQTGPENMSTPGPTFSADFDNSSGDIVTITGHIDIVSEEGKRLLDEKVAIGLQQSSPFTIDIVFGKKTLVLPLTFPAPVSKDGSKTRIARKSCFIEVVAPLAKPGSSLLDDFMFPTTLAEPSNIPATLNIPHLNLDSLPILALDDKPHIHFLTTLTSLGFTTRERRLREEAAAANTVGLSSSARLNFKESLFTIFMLASGLQGGQTGLFSLTQPDNGGIHMLLFVSAIRLDGAEGSAVLDAAVLPLTNALIGSGELEGFLLLLRTLECCALTVDDAELALWKRTLPALAERCRTWAHDPAACEYARRGRVPLSLAMGEQLLCACGQGRLPPEFIPLPEWDAAARFATRVAISPVYASGFVEELVDPAAADEEENETEGAGKGVAAKLKACRNCGKRDGGEGGVKLKKCMRCLEVAYCSPECQKKDWRKHRMECEEAEVYNKE